MFSAFLLSRIYTKLYISEVYMIVVKESSPWGRLTRQADEDNRTALDMVKEAIAQTGSIHAAALRLGVNPNTVRYHLKRAGLTVKTVTTVQIEEA